MNESKSRQKPSDPDRLPFTDARSKDLTLSSYTIGALPLAQLRFDDARIDVAAGNIGLSHFMVLAQLIDGVFRKTAQTIFRIERFINDVVFICLGVRQRKLLFLSGLERGPTYANDYIRT